MRTISQSTREQTGGDFLVSKNPQSMRRMKSSVVRLPTAFTGNSNIQNPSGYPVTKINDNLYEMLLAGREYSTDGFIIQGPSIVHKTGGDITSAAAPYWILDTEDTAQAACNENKIPDDLNGNPFDVALIKGTKPIIRWVTNPQTDPIPAEPGDLPLRFDPILYAPWPKNHPQTLITNGARDFNGTNQYFNRPNFIESTMDQSFWISCWVNTSSSVSQGIAGKWQTGGLEWLLYDAGTNFSFLGTGGSFTITAGLSVQNVWVHLFGVYDLERRIASLYQNIVKYTDPILSEVTPSLLDFRVGLHSVDNYFEGSICQLAFGKPTVPIAEVEEDILELLWNNGNIFSVADIPDPLLDVWGCRLTRWEFDERSGDVIPVEGSYNLTDNNNVGEANGVPTQYAINSNAKNIFFGQAKASISNPHPEAILGYDITSSLNLEDTGHLVGSSPVNERWIYDSPGVPNTGPQSVRNSFATGSYINCDSLISKVATDTTGTFMGWLKSVEEDRNYAVGVSNNSSASRSEIGLSLDMRVGVKKVILSCQLDDITQWQAESVTSGDIDININYHVALVHDGVEAKVYINAVEHPMMYTNEVDKTVWMNNIITLATDKADAFRFGALFRNGTLTFGSECLQSNWNYYNVPLNQAQIQSHFEGNDVTPNRIFNYPMNDGGNRNGTLLPAGEENDSWVWDSTLSRWVWEGNGTTRYVEIEVILGTADYLYYWNDDKYETIGGVQYKNDIPETFTPHFYDDGVKIQLGKSGASVFLAGRMRDFQIKTRFELALDDGPDLPGQLLPDNGTQDQQWSSDAPSGKDWAWSGNGSTFYITNLRTIGSEDYSYYWDGDLYQLDEGVQKVNGIPQAFTPHFYDDGSIVQLGKSDAVTFLLGKMSQFLVPSIGTNHQLDEGPSGQTVIDGGSINRWLDLSRERNDILAYAPNQRPIKAADGAVQFDGVDDAMRTIREIVLVSGGEVTAFIVGNRTLDNAAQQQFIEQTANSGTTSGFEIISRPTGELTGFVNGIVAIAGTDTLNRKLLATIRLQTPGTFQLWDSKLLVGTQSGTGNLADDFLYIASRNLASLFMGGKLYTIGIYPTALSDQNIEQLQDWLINELDI